MVAGAARARGHWPPSASNVGNRLALGVIVATAGVGRPLSCLPFLNDLGRFGTLLPFLSPESGWRWAGRVGRGCRPRRRGSRGSWSGVCGGRPEPPGAHLAPRELGGGRRLHGPRRSPVGGIDQVGGSWLLVPFQAPVRRPSPRGPVAFRRARELSNGPQSVARREVGGSGCAGQPQVLESPKSRDLEVVGHGARSVRLVRGPSVSVPNRTGSRRPDQPFSRT
jgi:hypothetical protein